MRGKQEEGIFNHHWTMVSTQLCSPCAANTGISIPMLNFLSSRSTEYHFTGLSPSPTTNTCGAHVPCDLGTHGCRPIHSHFEPHASFFHSKILHHFPLPASFQGLWCYLCQGFACLQTAMTDFTLDGSDLNVCLVQLKEPSCLPATWREGEKKNDSHFLKSGKYLFCCFYSWT